MVIARYDVILVQSVRAFLYNYLRIILNMPYQLSVLSNQTIDCTLLCGPANRKTYSITKIKTTNLNH